MYTHTAAYKYYLCVWGKYFLTRCDSMSDLVGYSSELLPVVLLTGCFFLFQIIAFSFCLEDCSSYFVGAPLGGHCSLICPTICGLFFPFAGLPHPFGSCVYCIEVMSMSFRSCDKSMAHVIAQDPDACISPLWRYVCLS